MHDFDLRRDGWRLADLAALVARHGLRDASGRRCARSGAARLELRKRFFLALGRLEGDSGATSGFLAHGPGGPPTAGLTLACCGGGPVLSVALERGLPVAGQGVGRGLLLDPRGWEATEVWRYDYATGHGALSGGSDYVPARWGEGPEAP